MLIGVDARVIVVVVVVVVVVLVVVVRDAGPLSVAVSVPEASCDRAPGCLPRGSICA